MQLIFNPSLTMKKTILKTLFLAIALPVAAGVHIVDISTLSTNLTHSSGWITIPGVCTNAPYTTTNPASIMTGEPLPVSFSKVNSNAVFLQTLFNSTSNTLMTGFSTLTISNNYLFGIQASTNALVRSQIAALKDTNTLFASQLDTVAAFRTNFNGYGAIAFPVTTVAGDPRFIYVDGAGNLTNTAALP